MVRIVNLVVQQSPGEETAVRFGLPGTLEENSTFKVWVFGRMPFFTRDFIVNSPELHALREFLYSWDPHELKIYVPAGAENLEFLLELAVFLAVHATKPRTFTLCFVADTADVEQISGQARGVGFVKENIIACQC